MKNITRREFISQMLLILPSPVIVGTAFANYQEKIDSSKLDPLFIQECRIVYQEWKKKELIDPADYLQKAMVDSLHKRWSLSEATKLDFQNKNLFSVSGLQLGKTEAAFLALLGA